MASRLQNDFQWCYVGKPIENFYVFNPTYNQNQTDVNSKNGLLSIMIKSFYRTIILEAAEQPGFWFRGHALPEMALVLSQKWGRRNSSLPWMVAKFLISKRSKPL